MKSFASGMLTLFSVLTSTAAESGTNQGAGTNQTPLSPKNPQSDQPVWADLVETNFPFFSSALDARNLGPPWPTNNLTPRGLILNLGNGCWGCFDTDLLRMSAIWSGVGVSPDALPQVSYHKPFDKTSDGQDKLPKILGAPWLVSGIYPGWQAAEKFTLTDPREPGPDEREVGRGPIDPSASRFRAVRLTQAGLCLEYEVAGAFVREWVDSQIQSGKPVVQRCFRLTNVKHPLWLILGQRPSFGKERPRVVLKTDKTYGKRLAMLVGVDGRSDDPVAVRVEASDQPIEFRVAMGMSPAVRAWGRPTIANADSPAASRWPQTLTTRGSPSSAKDAYVVDTIPLPLANPWKRNIRLADIAFFRNGRAAASTLDGDVWIISGLKGDLNEIKWRRFASGLHEPLGICVRDEELFVNDRHGIWRLRDTDGNGEADVHELFSNAFTQTAETREFPMGFRLAPDSSFVIAKGGQQFTTIGKDNGKVLRVSPDGKSASVIGWGLRMPAIGVNPKTGLVTASDQQGNYVPTTPLHIIRDNQYYGYLSLILPKEQYPSPITEPLTWIPYPINASAAAQVWLTDARMGPLNDALIHIGYSRPELFLVLLNQRASRTQAAVVSITHDLDFSPLNGCMNPIDGQLYVTGFQIWGSKAKTISGLARLRYTGEPSTLPRELIPADKGILLRFDVPLDVASASNPANYSAERWNYLRKADYGSPHFKPDGSKGQESMPPSSAYVSKDGKSVFLGIPDMKPVMQMRVGWALKTKAGAAFERNAYLTPYEFTRFDPEAEGFGPLAVDLTPPTNRVEAVTPLTVEEGRRLAELMGCAACHSTDGSVLGRVGPTWKGLFGSERTFADGSKAQADEDYLRQSIREPAAKIVHPFQKSDTAMPSYAGVLTEPQIEALILYIKSLR